MKKEKLENNKMEENDLKKIAGGYTPHVYYSGSDDNPYQEGYLAVSKEEYDLLKEKGFINPYDDIDGKHVHSARQTLRSNGFNRDNNTKSKKDWKFLRIDP